MWQEVLSEKEFMEWYKATVRYLEISEAVRPILDLHLKKAVREALDRVAARHVPPQ